MRPDFSKMSVDECRALLCEKSGMSAAEAEQIKPKSAVVEQLLQFYANNDTVTLRSPAINIDNPFSEAEPETVELQSFEVRGAKVLEETVDAPTTVPSRGSAGWQGYVLGLLTEDEYIEKDGKRHPKASGLRRITEMLLGPIVKSGPVMTETIGNGKTVATVVYEVVIDWHRTGVHYTYSDVADAGPINTPAEYAKHASATASSRAAGRAFRAALLLTVNTAEEVNSASSAPVETMNDDMRMLDDKFPISGTQMLAVKNVARNVGVDVDALLAQHGFPSLESITSGDAKMLLLELNRYGSGALSLPDSLRVVEGEK